MMLDLLFASSVQYMSSNLAHMISYAMNGHRPLCNDMEIPCTPQMTQPDTSPAWRHAHPSFAANPNLTDRWFVLGRGAQTALSGRQAAESRSSQRRLPISPPNSG